MQKATQLSLQALILTILLVSLTVLMLNTNGLVVWVESIVLLFLTLASAAGLIMIKERTGHQILFIVYVVYFCNLLVISVIQNTVYVILFLLSIVGGIITLLHHHKSQHTFVQPVQEPHSVVFDTPAKKTTQYSPGKYVASKNGKFYHEPKSEWAQKIKKENQVWFTSKEEAWQAGYRAHKAVSS